MAVAVLLLAISLGAAGQILLKSGLSQLGSHPRPLVVLASIFTNLRVFGGFFCYGVSSLFYLLALSRLDLSYAYPMIALGYVIVTYLSWQFLGETVPSLRIVGLGIIILGVIVMALTYGQTHARASSPTPPAVSAPLPPAGP